jgi:hypothetical protein
MDDISRSTLEARIAELERRLPRAGELKGSVETAFWALMHNVLPEDTRHHMKAAGREQLLAARSYLDHWIARLDEKPAAANGSPRETIEVE